MSVNHTQSCRLLPDEFTIKRVESEEEWMRMQQLSEEEDPDQPWYDPSYTGPNRLFEKTRFVSESVGIEWFYIAERGGSEMLAKLGMFIHNGIARLQDVATSRNHRRRGLASYLVSAAIHRALELEGAALLSLAADMDYHAVDLYRKLGFEDVGEYLTLMKYPILNPVHQNVG
jgi:ribosomal protein S18 acetylase RimI-like enzyme